MQSDTAYTNKLDVEDLVKTQRTKSITQLLLGMTILALISVPLSISRSIYTGWLLAYSVHLIVLALLLYTSYFRNKLTLEFKTWVPLGIAFLVSMSGLLTYGIFGGGIIWAGFSILVSTAFMKEKVTLILIGLLLSIYGYSAYQFTMAGKIFPVDADIYLSEVSSWASAFFGCAVFVMLLTIIYHGQQQQTRKLIEQLDKQNTEISRLADYDNLTGLPVFRLFNRAVQNTLLQQEREKRFVAVFFMDLDGFKQVNDTYGHDAGDLILKSVAKRIVSHIRRQDVAARMGGDEFVILINDPETIELDELCLRLIKSIQEPHIYNDLQLTVGVSIGVAKFTSNQANPENSEQLLKRADEAMYKVKGQGKNGYLISA